MNKMLSSWKEIAHFFGKGVRTVQRWEKTLDLPIRRPPGAPSNVVLARTSDLEAWMHRGPGKAAVTEPDQDEARDIAVVLVELENELRAMIQNAGGHMPAHETDSQAPTADRLQQMLTDLRSCGLGSRSEEHQLRKAA